MNYINFGDAIEAVKKGKSAARYGWNGKQMFIYLKKGSADYNNPTNTHIEFIEGIHHSLFESGDKGSTTKLPTICFKTAKGSILEGWLASQSDILAEDWYILD